VLIDRLKKYIPIPYIANPTIPWTVPSAPAGAIRAAYEMAAEYGNPYVKPSSTSTSIAHRGSLMNEYEVNIQKNPKNMKENTTMWSTRFNI